MMGKSSYLKQLLTGGLIALFQLLAGCGDPPPDMPAPVENVGSLYIACSVEINADSTFVPERLDVTLDGNSLGWSTNPVILTSV